MSAAGEKLVEAARQVSGSRVGPAHGWEWVDSGMAAFSIKRYEGSSNCFINMEAGNRRRGGDQRNLENEDDATTNPRDMVLHRSSIATNRNRARWLPRHNYSDARS
jgi:hypothetical protein